MKGLLRLSIMLARLAALVLLACAMLFWIGALYYTVRGFASGGIAGARGWLLHVFSRVSKGSLVPVPPGWDGIALRLFCMMAITVLLWRINHRPLRQFGRELLAYVAEIRNPGRHGTG